MQIFNPELIAMNEVLGSVKKLTDAQRARVFQWVEAAIADELKRDAQQEAEIADFRRRQRENAAPASPASLPVEDVRIEPAPPPAPTSDLEF